MQWILDQKIKRGDGQKMKVVVVVMPYTGAGFAEKEGAQGAYKRNARPAEHCIDHDQEGRCKVVYI